jgi:hypothetical protein
MTRLRLSLLALVLVSVSACAAFRDALTGHADLVARAGSQELTVDELAAMMANSPAPLRPDIARSIVQLWVNYQLVGTAAAHGDTLRTPELADQGMWSALEQLRLQKYFEAYTASLPQPDPATFEAAYNNGELLAAAHILLAKQPEGLGLANDSIKREAERIAQTVTSATFARVARQRSQDPGSKDRGGDYGLFPRGQMVPEFDQGILSVPPGGITGVVETAYGYHIIRRSTYAEIRDQFAEAYTGFLGQKAESTFFASVDAGANIEVKRSAPKLVRAIAEDVDAYRDDRSVVATSRRGNLTAGRLAHWVAAFPPQSQLRIQIAQAPDSLLPQFVINIMKNELLLKAADSAGVQLDTAEITSLRTAFYGAVGSVMTALNLTPQALADSAADESAREELAARRVADYMAGLFRNEREYVEVPEQIALVLRDRYEARVVTAAIDRALAAATRLRSAADSTASADAPASAVPLPAPATPTPR